MRFSLIVAIAIANDVVFTIAVDSAVSQLCAFLVVRLLLLQLLQLQQWRLASSAEVY